MWWCPQYQQGIKGYKKIHSIPSLFDNLKLTRQKAKGEGKSAKSFYHRIVGD